MPDVTSGLQTREITTELHTRAGEDSHKREVSGIGVPYDQPIEIFGIREEFAPGSVEAEDVMLFWRHRDPIGKVTAHRNDDDGWHYDARISQTHRGDEAYTLARDGVITRSSIGFEPIEHIETKAEDGTITIRHTKVRVREVSLVPIPAYAGATVQQVREKAGDTKEENMPDTITKADLDEVRSEIRSSIEDIDREVKLLAAREPEEPAVETRSAGELIKAITSGDEDAIRSYNDTLKRAYEGGTTADAIVKNGWVGDMTRLVDQAAGVRALFATGTLPREGNHLEYGKLKSNTAAVAEQENEGDDLVFGKVQVETDTAPVKTYGGYTRLTRQEIERSSTNILDLNLRAQAIAAGKALNAAFRAHYAATVTAQRTANNVVEVPEDATYVDWLDAVVDAAIKYEDLGLSLDALVVDPTYFKAFNRFVGEDGRPLFTVSGTGANTVGSLDVKALRGDLASIPVRLNAKQTTAGAAFVHSDAIRTYASPITRLQDENIINLSKDFSVYFYAAFADEIPQGIVPVRRTAA